jgi:dTMP kinase
VRALDAQARDGLVPALTFVFDCPVEEGLARARARAGTGDRFEREVVSFHERVRRGFQEMAHAEPARFRVLDSAAPVDDVHAAVVAETEKLLAGRP